MKKLAYSLIAMAMAAFTFTSCEDVPEPFGQPVAPSNGETVTVNPAGSNTEADPYNVAAALEAASALTGDDAGIEMIVKGYVTTIDEIDVSGSYGNATYYISDDADGKANKLEIYRGYGLNGQKFNEAGATVIKVGDLVVVKGTVVNFRGTTLEFTTGSQLLSVNGEGGSVTPADDGEVKSVTIAEFNAAAESSVWYQLTGTVKNLKDGDQYGNFDIEDATGSVYVYGLVAEKGGESMKFQDLVAAKGIKNGSKITIIGNRGSYNDKIEVMNAYFVSIEGGETPDTPTPSGNNLLTNGDFETWSDGLPTGWKSASTASSSTLSQSTDAHAGSYSVKVGGDANSNKRLACTEITLKAGTYTFSFYAKSTTADASQTRPGYVPVTDGKVGNYAYGDYASINNTSWTQVSTTFTLTAETTVCLVVMNPKTSSYATAQDILIDDATLTTTDGGLASGGDNGGGNGGGSTSDVQKVSIAEFNAAAESTTVWYQLTGTISNLKDNDQYGNFDLTDDSGSVYVYGVLSEKGGAKKKFQELVSAHNIKNGTKITIIGNRGSYNDKIEVVNAYFVSAE